MGVNELNSESCKLLLVTGATGLVGSHVAEKARQLGIRTRALVRETSQSKLLEEWGVELVHGDMTDEESLKQAVADVDTIVHCAAKVGDWGPVEKYREVNVEGLGKLLEAAENSGSLKKFVHISSLGVYEARDHDGTDETVPPNVSGIDGYTLTKAEGENLVLKHISEKQLPAVILRPGFVYGTRDRIVLPRVMERLKNQTFKFLGTGDQLMNNVHVDNLVAAVNAAIEHDNAVGEIYNITDGRLVTKKEFFTTIAKEAGYPIPDKSVPLPVARVLAKIMESTWRLLGKQEAPLLSSARIKFLGLNLGFSIEKARKELDYDPKVDFADGMRQTIEWCRSENFV